MKLRRTIPNTISKRSRRKLRRSKNPYLLWIRCRHPYIYSRLRRYWDARFWSLITTIEPWKTPFVSEAPKVSAREIAHTWVTDTLFPIPNSNSLES